MPKKISLRLQWVRKSWKILENPGISTIEILEKIKNLLFILLYIIFDWQS